METIQPRLILAAPMSSSGKTTVMAGVIAALVARGVTVAPFKTGPDYIDPTYHALAARQICANLDAWLTPPHLIPDLLAHRAAQSDLALIEGVMGLYDGHAGEGDVGSTAHIARITNTPVILVLDVRGMARTAAALVIGLRDFDPRVQIAGIILNRVGSPRHAQMVADAIEATTHIPILGYLLRTPTLTLPERHLGLIPVGESIFPGTSNDDRQQWLTAAQHEISAHVDLDKLLAIAKSAPPLAIDGKLFSTTHHPTHTTPTSTTPTIAVARDEAFSFVYEDNLDLLRGAGANIVAFSPIHDTMLPPATAGIYLGGGFPEVYASALARNHAMHAAIRHAAHAGIPIYAECGGLIYLTEAVVAADGQVSPLVGLLAGRANMTQRVKLGYRTVRARQDTWLLHKGEEVRGHEFHYSQWQAASTSLSAIYTVQPDQYNPHPWHEGVCMYNVLASYIHLHFLAKPELAARFVAAARAAMPITPCP